MNMIEKQISTASGFIFIGLGILSMIIGFFLIKDYEQIVFGGLLLLMSLVCLTGLSVINPNEAAVVTFFGKYQGTIKENGLRWVNPFFLKKKISLRARNLNGQKLKVNDKMGNPIEIAAIVVWRVNDTAKASFEVDNYISFVDIQSEAAVRKLAVTYAYDNNEDENATIYLRDSSGEISQVLEAELHERLALAGIEVIEARISHLAYASEIAGAMLQRQQASAVVAARKQIVDGAVGMVEMALTKLSEKNIVQLDDERKAAMVSNLLVVLCGEHNVTPIVNTGSIY
jgi:regulator of protease activity HflC (stomatin/prohibitin superfamily)